MEEGAVEQIIGVAQRAAGQNVVVDTVHGERSTIPLHDARLEDPEPSPLVVYSLAGLVEYLRANRDELPTAGLMVHVVGPRGVEVVSNLQGLEQRFTYVRAKCRNRMSAANFRFGSWFGTEELIIAVQALFHDDFDRSLVLKLLGTITDEAVRTEKDDGVTQKVTARAGVALENNVAVPNPVDLAPFRTFAEIDQPVSPFILRVRKTEKGIQGALFEADGGAWKREATTWIHDWLATRLDEQITIIA